MMTGQSVTSVGTGTIIEVWYNVDMAHGLFPGASGCVYRGAGNLVGRVLAGC